MNCDLQKSNPPNTSLSEGSAHCPPPPSTFYSCTILLIMALESWDQVYLHPRHSLLNIPFAFRPGKQGKGSVLKTAARGAQRRERQASAET